MDVAAQPIELRNDDRRLVLARGFESGRELGPAIKRIGPLASFHLLERFDQLIALSLGEPRESCLLRLKAQPRAALMCCGDSGVGDGGFHGKCPPTRNTPIRVAAAENCLARATLRK
jgi:hypothetical protein